MDEEEEEEEEGVPIINTLYSSKRTHSDIREHLLQWLLKEFDQSCAENSMCAFVACACACVQDEVVRHPAQGARPQLSKAVVVHGRVGAGIKGVQPPSCVHRPRTRGPIYSIPWSPTACSVLPGKRSTTAREACIGGQTEH